MKKKLCKVFAVLFILLFVASSSTVYADLSPNGEGDIVLGTTSNEVVAIQQRLLELGYNPGMPDGYYGIVTQTAVMLFQAANGLFVDGVVGPITMSAIFKEASYQESNQENQREAEEQVLPAPAQPDAPAQSEQPAQLVQPLQLTLGATGDGVRAVQQRLTELGYNPGPVDGYYGVVTQTAVMLFQAANGLYVDGIVGPYTQNALFGDLDVAAKDGDEPLSVGGYGSYVQFFFYQNGWYVARFAVELYNKNDGSYRWVYSDSATRGQRVVFNVNVDGMKITRVGYQIWAFGWDHMYYYMPWVHSNYSDTYYLSGYGDHPQFTWKEEP